MAGVIDNKTQQELEAAQAAQNQAAQTQTGATSATTNGATTLATGNTATAVKASTPMKGVTENTANKLNQYSQGYQPGSAVQAAQGYLNNVLNNKPVADAQLSQLYDKIMNREQFSYDLNGDMLYQQYKDQYMNAGKQAMMDTMGNAATLTGGYGSSYASTAGNQAYQQYMQQLNNIVPELYQQALQQYNQEGANLQNLYNMAYGQYRDQVGDWTADRDYANTDYWNKYNAEYSDYQNMLNYWNQMAQQENEAFLNNRDHAYELALGLIRRRILPSAELLAAADMTEDVAIALGARKPGTYSSSSSSSSKSSSSKKSSSSSSSSSKSTSSSNAPAIISPNVTTPSSSKSTMSSSTLMSMMASAANSKYKNKATGK